MRTKFCILPLLVLLILLLNRCTKSPGLAVAGSDDNNYPGFKTYLIEKGQNYCVDNTYAPFNQESMEFDAVFDSTCIYTTINPVNQADINKLMGFADCSAHHQVNSARFGWNWENNQLNIFAYCYVNSERKFRRLGSVPLSKARHYKLSVSSNYYLFELNGVIDTMPRYCSTVKASGYKLLPYFGGDETAPNNIKIRVKEY